MSSLRYYNNAFRHKDILGCLWVDDEGFSGYITDIEDGYVYQGDTIYDTKKRFESMVELYLENNVQQCLQF